MKILHKMFCREVQLPSDSQLWERLARVGSIRYGFLRTYTPPCVQNLHYM